jgi:uncharacterized protein YabN with tetrapyrrole methylase and pyrophosphatase domain
MVGQLTKAAQQAIATADCLYYLINDRLMAEWLAQLNPNSQSLAEAYYSHNERAPSYQAVTQVLIDAVHSGLNVCAIFYGHPTVFATPGLMAVKTLRHQGFRCQVLPAISAADCLFADLLIDPGQNGCQFYEATDFLRQHHPLHTASHLLLWQVSTIFADHHVDETCFDRRPGLLALQQRLLKYYPKNHPIVFYEAARHPGFHPTVMHTTLATLAKINFPRHSILYLSPQVDD